MANHRLGIVGTVLLGGALKQALDNLLSVSGDLHGHIQAQAIGAEHTLKLLNLVQSARVTIQQETLDGVVPVQAVVHQAVSDLVGDVLALVNVALGSLTQLSAFSNVLAEDVTGGNSRDV